MARKGILGTKLGMTQVFDENNRIVPVTVVKAGPNVVTRIRTPETDGYSAVQLAYGEISPRKVNKPVTGQYAAAGVNPRRHLAEFRLDNPDADTDLGFCKLGPVDDYSSPAPCAWVADKRCYTEREMACNCACPRSRNSQCSSGFDAGPDGHVWVSCN